MTGFSERLSAIKAKQEDINVKRKETAASEAEAARVEREAVRNELSSKHEELQKEFKEAEKVAADAHQAVLEADAFVQEQGESIDPEVAEEIATMKSEAAEARRKFIELQSQLESVSNEIRTFDELNIEEGSSENSVEPAENEKLTSESLETLKVELQEMKEDEVVGIEKINNIAKFLKTNAAAEQSMAELSDVAVKWESIWTGGDTAANYLTLIQETEKLREFDTRRRERKYALGTKSFEKSIVDSDPVLIEIENERQRYADELRSKGLGFASLHRDSPVQTVIVREFHGARLLRSEEPTTLKEVFASSETKFNELSEKYQGMLTDLRRDIATLETKLPPIEREG